MISSNKTKNKIIIQINFFVGLFHPFSSDTTSSHCWSIQQNLKACLLVEFVLNFAPGVIYNFF